LNQNLEEKYKLEEFLYNNYPERHKILFREYHNIISIITLNALNTNFFHDPEINDSLKKEMKQEIFKVFNNRILLNNKFFH